MGSWKVFVRSGLLVLLLVFGVKCDSQCDFEVENTLRTLLGPQEQFSLQVQALRRELLKRLQHALEVQENSTHLDDKRNLEALARNGYITTQPETKEEENLKRSLADLAKNDDEGARGVEKRGIEALARNGELNRRLEAMEEGGQDGGAVVYYYYTPYGKRYLESQGHSKRSIASLAREGMISGKRNVAALLRQDEYKARQGEEFGKRNLASVKAQLKAPNYNKRQVDYDDETALQEPDDYELMKFLDDISAEKRFLGSVARSGWYRKPSTSSESYDRPEKRHIGSLARIGWLPSFRSTRRFNRSGRSARYDSDCGREAPANGEAEDTSSPKTSIQLEGKRFLLQPAVDNILLRRILYHPRSH